MPSSLNRRSFIHSSASFGLTALWSMQALGAVKKLPRLADYPFQLGVGSGDPSPDGFVLWTRLAPKPVEGGGMEPESVEVSWQVADDEGMTRVVKRGKAIANPDWGHSVHVEVSGLRPDRWYWYQFKVGHEVSQKGRARTFPKRDAIPAQLRFAFASCQHYETGYYTAYDHMVQEGVDVIVHLGDYIYEGGAATDARPRKHNSKKIFTIDEYRNRYGLYKSDESLKRAHAAAPWLVTPDDHEVENNYADEISEVRYVTRKEFLKHRAVAYQAYYEHMPLRRSSLPQGPDMQLYRGIPFGRLAQFFVLDTRQHRTDQTCGDGTKAPCDEEMDSKGTALGDTQRDWLFKGLRGASPSTWNVLAQQVMMARVDMRAGPEQAVSHDQWPSYEFERRRVLQYLRDQRIQNSVVLTGDIHSNWANDLIANFDELDSETVAAEFVGTSISSGGDGGKNEARMKSLMSENPFVKYFNAERGYVCCHVTPKQWRTDYRMVDYVAKPGSPIGTRASFTIENGHPGLQRA